MTEISAGMDFILKALALLAAVAYMERRLTRIEVAVKELVEWKRGLQARV